MSKKIGGIVALAGLCALSLLLLNCGSSSSRPSGVLYVLTEGGTGIGNVISSYSVDLNSGELSLVNSNASACPTAPTQGNPSPCGAPVNIVLDPTGSVAFVLDQGLPCVETEVKIQPDPQDPPTYAWQCISGSNAPVLPTIYPYAVGNDGSLTGPATGVTWSCPGLTFANPCNESTVAMARDAAGQFLFVLNHGSYPSPGQGDPSQGFPSPYASCPHVPTDYTDVCPSISVFTMKPGSPTLTLAPGSPFYLSKLPTALSTVSFAAQGSNNSQELLFVTENQDICTANCQTINPNDNAVSEYLVSSTGTLSELPNSPYAINAVDPVSVQAVNTNQVGQNATGVYVYVGNNGSTGDLNPFYVCTVQTSICTAQDVINNGVPVYLMAPLVQACSKPPCDPVLPSAAGLNPVGMVVDPTNNFLYSISNGSNQVFGFKINTTTGVLTAQSPANQPTGSQPVSIALHPSVNNTGQFLFVSNSNSDNISSFTLNTTAGSMGNPSTVVAPETPSGLTVR
ncbi:MAG: beta-propeller fold lactonase family protein [Terriglobales bacterium]|jgi:hypothetical protein